MKRTLLAVLMFSSLLAFGQRNNVQYVDQFPGVDVATKVTFAQAACNPDATIPCIIVFDTTLAAFPTGSLPGRCAQCQWVDWSKTSGVVFTPTSGSLPSGFSSGTNQMFAPNATATAPAYSFATATNLGLYRRSATEVGYASASIFMNSPGNSTAIFYVDSTNIRTTNTGKIGFSATSDALGGTFDSALSRVSAGLIAVGNGTQGDTSGQLAVAAIRSNTASNTDLAGLVTLATGAGSYTFAKTYASGPVCTCTDTTAAAAVKCSTTTTTLSITGTGSDVIAYICAGRN